MEKHETLTYIVCGFQNGGRPEQNSNLYWFFQLVGKWNFQRTLIT